MACNPTSIQFLSSKRHAVLKRNFLKHMQVFELNMQYHYCDMSLTYFNIF